MTSADKAFSPDDLFLELRIEAVDLRAAGDLAVCEVKSVHREDDNYQTHLWLAPLQGGTLKRLTTANTKHRSPCWSPSGDQIAFLCDRHGGAPQVYTIKPDGGEAVQLTRFVSTVVDMAWHPNGRQMALVCAVNVDPNQREEGTQEVDLQQPIRPASEPEVVWRLPYKMDGAGYTLSSRLHLVLYDIESGATTPLTRGDYNVGKIAWSEDGKRLAFTRTREADRETHCADLWVLDIADNCRPFPPARRLSTDVATAAYPAWSPDGSTIAFIGAENGGDAIMRLWWCDTTSGVVRRVGNLDLELVPGRMFWDAGNRKVRAVQAWRGVQRIVAIDSSGEVEVLVDPGIGHVSALAVANASSAGATSAGAMVYAEEGLDHPMDLHASGLDGSEQRKLSHLNAWWQDRTPVRAQRRRFRVPDGDGGTEEIEGWLLQGQDSPGPTRLLVDVHGGPASYVLVDYSTSPYWHALVSQGWTVLALNAVGSSSFGSKFSARLRRRWGQLDLPQHLAAIETLQGEGLVDERVAIAGSSYGGYFSAYATGNCRSFRAAVVSAPVGNLETHYGTSDSGYYADPYSMEGKPEVDRALMVELSPMSHITQSRTPTLFLQGKEDERCPKCQSEEMFVKLRRSGTTSEMILYPQGDHHTLGKGRPSHRLDAHNRIVEWLNRWVEVPLPADGDDQKERKHQKDRHDGD